MRRRVIAGVSVVIGGLVVITLTLLASELGPKPVDRNEMTPAFSYAEKAADERAQIKVGRDKISALLASGTPQDKVLPLLEKVLDSQKRLVRMEGTIAADERDMREVVAQIDTIRSAELAKRSQDAEDRGMMHEAAGELDKATYEYGVALQTLQELRNKYPYALDPLPTVGVVETPSIQDVRAPSAESRSVGRLARLSSKHATLLSRNLAKEIGEAHAALLAQVQKGETPDAEIEAAYAVLIAKRLKLNKDYPQSLQASRAELVALERELLDFKASRLDRSLSESLVKARVFESEGKFEEAAQAVDAAQKIQLQINRMYPECRFASSARVDELEVVRQNFLSVSLVDSLASMDVAMGAYLRERNFAAAAQQLEMLKGLLERIRSLYHKTPRLDPTIAARIEFLVKVGGSLESLHGRISEMLVPARGLGDGALVLRTEVPQSIYQALMGANPSRRKGEDLPVESVDWLKASECARRMGWILGMAGRLPSDAEMRTLVGNSLDYDADKIWSAVTVANGVVQPVGKSKANRDGVHDLLGNVSEWLDETLDSKTANVLGGAVSDDAASMRQMKALSYNKIEANRYLGFRVVVKPLAR